MKKYKIIYQENQNTKEIILETSNINNEKLPKNILKIIELNKTFEFELFKKIKIEDKALNLVFYELNLMLYHLKNKLIFQCLFNLLLNPIPIS